MASPRNDLAGPGHCYELLTLADAKGRKPTPWTMPSTRTAVLTGGVTGVAVSPAAVRGLLEGHLVAELERAEEAGVRGDAELALLDGGAPPVLARARRSPRRR